MANQSDSNTPPPVDPGSQKPPKRPEEPSFWAKLGSGFLATVLLLSATAEGVHQFREASRIQTLERQTVELSIRQQDDERSAGKAEERRERFEQSWLRHRQEEPPHIPGSACICVRIDKSVTPAVVEEESCEHGEYCDKMAVEACNTRYRGQGFTCGRSSREATAVVGSLSGLAH